MEFINLNHRLKEILEAHGLPCTEHQDWLVPNNTLPLIMMTWYPRPDGQSGVLQIDIYIECFAGFGTGDEGVKNGIENFCRNSLHVILAALWGINDQHQVDIEQWKIGNNSYTAYIGPFGTRATDGKHPGIPEDAFRYIEYAIKNSLDEKPANWFRTYFGNINNHERIFEALQNNNHWPVGDEMMRKINWIDDNNFYSVRNFVVVVKNP
jgi:hypothetical protein